MPRVQLYGYDINCSKVLTDKELLDNFKRYKNGDKEARNNIILSNIKLVLSLAQKYYNNKVDIEDLFYAGVVGLIKAIDGFNTDYNVKFSTYAVPMISGEIRRVVKDKMGIKIPRALRDIAYKATVFKRDYYSQNLKNPSYFEIANEIGVLEEDVVRAFCAVSDVTSLYENVYSNEEDSVCLIDQIADECVSYENIMTKYLIRKAIITLPEKERKVIYLRYYENKTQADISNILNISQAQVSRLEKSGLNKVKEYME